MENQFENSALNASQEYLNDHASDNGNWMNKVSNAIPETLKHYGTTAATQVKNMSTTQKVAGGALLAAGAYYLANRTSVNNKIQSAIASRNSSTAKTKKAKHS